MDDPRSPDPCEGCPAKGWAAQGHGPEDERRFRRRIDELERELLRSQDRGHWLEQELRAAERDRLGWIVRYVEKEASFRSMVRWQIIEATILALGVLATLVAPFIQRLFGASLLAWFALLVLTKAWVIVTSRTRPSRSARQSRPRTGSRRVQFA